MGPSGSGKSVIEKVLRDPENGVFRDFYTDMDTESKPVPIFHKLPQMTTRQKRVSEENNSSNKFTSTEDPYIFISREMYEEYKECLIGTCRHGNSLYGTLPLILPTIPCNKDLTINTIILSADGLSDFFDKIKNSKAYPFKSIKESKVNIYIAYLDSLSNEKEVEERPDRDLNFERKSFLEGIIWEVSQCMSYGINIRTGVFFGKEKEKDLVTSLSSWLHYIYCD
jgi:hypothetical protein